MTAPPGPTGTEPATLLGAARVLLRRARTVPALRGRYPSGDLTALEDLARLPTISKDDLALTYDDTAARSARIPAYVLASGGSTGRPKVSHLPADMFVDDIRRFWTPLGEGDVFLNAYAAGRLWSSHYFHNLFAAGSRSHVMPLGSVAGDELEPWLEFCLAQRVTAIGATATTLYALLDLAARRSRRLCELQAVLWAGEPWSGTLEQLLTEVAPNAGRWGLYGSTETWVIATNGPRCAPDTFHPVPYQWVLLGDGGRLDVTCLHPAALNLILRYQPGDMAEFVECRCGRASGPAVRLLGRDDDVVKFRGALLHPDDLVAAAVTFPGVDRAQLVVLDPADRSAGHGAELEMHVVLGSHATPGTPRDLGRHLLASSLDLSNLFTTDSCAFRVRVVSRLAGVERSAKTPSVIWRSQ